MDQRLEVDLDDVNAAPVDRVNRLLIDVDAEHLDHYGSIEALRRAFVEFANRIPFYGAAVLCIDDPGARAVLKRVTRRTRTYGLGPDAELCAEEVEIHEESGLGAGHRDVPAHAYRDGCGWPESFALPIGADWPSGYYRAVLRAGEHEAEHFFVVRSANPGAHARHVLVLATNTYQAYNAWGGLNLYGNDASFASTPTR